LQEKLKKKFIILSDVHTKNPKIDNFIIKNLILIL
jgi:hypothetical protein